jgi:hypothetical protein
VTRPGPDDLRAHRKARVLRLTLLAHDLVKAILDGRQPRKITLGLMMEPFREDWERQKDADWNSPFS